MGLPEVAVALSVKVLVKDLRNNLTISAEFFKVYASNNPRGKLLCAW
ncbi:hypothetical protein CHB7_gp2 [Enterobacteria phage CHB7]|uniref:Uncharacterized protein n=1 Tax=Enterobacteria phage CHB7 TaxID=2530182 RepID=A0A482JG87_9CAUD|nr:hypothetical protein CHB7_gp2 [Enterobacteria phage CHB7]